MKRRHHHDFIWEFVDVIQVFDDCLENDTHEEVENGLRDDAINAQDIEAQEGKIQGEDAIMMLQQSKGANSFPC